MQLFQIKRNMCYPGHYITRDYGLKVSPILKIFLSVQNMLLLFVPENKLCYSPVNLLPNYKLTKTYFPLKNS